MKIKQIDPRKGPLGHSEALSQATLALGKLFPRNRYQVVCLVLFPDPESQDANYMNILATSPVEDEVFDCLRALLEARDMQTQEQGAIH